MNLKNGTTTLKIVPWLFLFGTTLRYVPYLCDPGIPSPCTLKKSSRIQVRWMRLEIKLWMNSHQGTLKKKNLFKDWQFYIECLGMTCNGYVNPLNKS